MRLFPKIYLIAGSAYGSHQNVFAIRAENSVILIDTGKNYRDYDLILRNLTQWELNKLPISAVLLTHEHYEHAANAYLFQQNDIPIYASQAAADALQAGDERVAAYAHPFEAPFNPVNVDYRLHDDEAISIDGIEFHCLNTPGHSAGSMVYQLILDNQHIIFLGDMLIPTIICSSVKMGWTGAIDYNRLSLLDSIVRLSKLDHTDVLLPGHGSVCLREGQQLLKEGIVQARLVLKHVPVCDPIIVKEND